MANYDFTDAAEEEKSAKREHRQDLSRTADDLISTLTRFKGVYDTLYSLATTEEKTALDAKLNTFKLAAKSALGL